MKIREQTCNEYLREKVNELINNRGLKAKYICQKCNIGESFFSRWRSCKPYYDLDTKRTQALQAFLDTYK